MAKRSPPASTISAETIASVSGILMVKVVPAPANGVQIDRAADLLDIAAHDVHADAAAGNAGDLRGGGKAGREDEIANFAVGLGRHLGLAGKTALDRLGADAREIEAAAVVGDLDDDVTALVAGGEPDRATARLAGGEPLGRTLDAVIGAIAHQMRERILDQFEHLAVELGFGAVHFEFDFLAELGGQVAHDARQLLPRIADRLHARLHHAFLQLGGDVGEPLQRHLEVGILVAAHDLEKLIAGQHQFRNRGHQIIERVDADADRMAWRAFRRARRRFFAVSLAALFSGFGPGLCAALGVGPLERRFSAAAGCGDASSCGDRSRRAMPRELLDQIGVVAGRLLLLRFDGRRGSS